MIFGSGVLKGMGVTLKAFVESYFRKPEEGGLFTVEYPEKKLEEKERYRNFPFLVYDETPANLRCVACDICAKECPPKCIYIVREFDKGGKPLKRPAVFDIDFTVCMNCGICEEACPFDAIFMDHEFEITDSKRQENLLYHKEDLLKSNEHFQKIRPTDAKTVDERLAAAEAAALRKQQAQSIPSQTPANPPPPKTL